jgi:hypothetical protein
MEYKIGMDEMRNAYKVLIGKLEGKISLGRSRSRWDSNTKIDLKGGRCKGVDWIHLARKGSMAGSCEHTVNEASEFHKRRRISRLLSASQE